MPLPRAGPSGGVRPDGHGGASHPVEPDRGPPGRAGDDGRPAVQGLGVRGARGRSKALGRGLDLRVSLLLLFTLAWLATRFGASVLFAGLAAGVVVALLGEPRRVAQQLVGIGEGFLIPLFFVHLGTQLDAGADHRRQRADRLSARSATQSATLSRRAGSRSSGPAGTP